MPIFEYICTKCGKEDERIVKAALRDKQYCNFCDAPLKQKVSQVSFKLKGSGWAKDGYK